MGIEGPDCSEKILGKASDDSLVFERPFRSPFLESSKKAVAVPKSFQEEFSTKLRRSGENSVLCLLSRNIL